MQLWCFLWMLSKYNTIYQVHYQISSSGPVLLNISSQILGILLVDVTIRKNQMPTGQNFQQQTLAILMFLKLVNCFREMNHEQQSRPLFLVWPANRGCWYNVRLIFAQRRGQLVNIKPTLHKYLFTKIFIHSFIHSFILPIYLLIYFHFLSNN